MDRSLPEHDDGFLNKLYLVISHTLGVVKCSMFLFNLFVPFCVLLFNIISSTQSKYHQVLGFKNYSYILGHN